MRWRLMMKSMFWNNERRISIRKAFRQIWAAQFISVNIESNNHIHVTVIRRSGTSAPTSSMSNASTFQPTFRDDDMSDAITMNSPYRHHPKYQVNLWITGNPAENSIAIRLLFSSLSSIKIFISQSSDPTGLHVIFSMKKGRMGVRRSGKEKGTA